jgi:hypothetical protein
MTIEEGLSAYVLSSPEITSLIGNRIFPMSLPGDCLLPALTYQTISDPSEMTLKGESKHRHPRIQVSCWGSSYGSAKQLANLLRKQLTGYLKVFGDVNVGAVLYRGSNDLYSPEYSLFHVPVDFEIRYNET